MYGIYNHSSERMPEIADGSIDLVITDPPYNIGLVYGTQPDFVPRVQHHAMLDGVIKEITRVLKRDGRVIIHTPLKTHRDGSDCEFSNMIIIFAKRAGLHLVVSHDVIIEEDVAAGEIQEEIGCIYLNDWKKAKQNYACFHSKEHRILVFSKTKLPFAEGSTFGTYEYHGAEGHPCPSNWKYLNDILNLYFQPGFNVLDTFMGTGRLSQKVLERGGNFFGYEVGEEFFQTAQERLLKVKRV